MSFGFYRRASPHFAGRDGRVGPWVQTYTGRRFYFLEPRPQDIDLADIAWALAHLCRYNGHVQRFYSVAEHSLILSALVPAHLAAAALMHDAAEAYLGDVTRPLKQLLPDFAALDRRVSVAIAGRFGLSYPWHEAIKAGDMRLVGDERRELLGTEGEGAEWDWDPGPGWGVPIAGWAPVEAAERFLQRAADLGLGG